MWSGGASGGPWLANVDPKTGVGQLVAVLSGHSSSVHSAAGFFDSEEQNLYQTYQGLQAVPLRLVVSNWGGFDAATTAYSGGQQIGKIGHLALAQTKSMLVYPRFGAEATDTVNMTVRGQAILGRHQEYTRVINITELSSPSMMRFEYHGTTLVGFEFVRVMDGQRVDISAPLEASSDVSESVIVPVLVNSALVVVPVVVLAGAAAWFFRRRRARLNQPRHRAEGH